MVSLLRMLHNTGYVHRDIKPENFCVVRLCHMNTAGLPRGKAETLRTPASWVFGIGSGLVRFLFDLFRFLFVLFFEVSVDVCIIIPPPPRAPCVCSYIAAPADYRVFWQDQGLRLCHWAK